VLNAQYDSQRNVMLCYCTRKQILATYTSTFDAHIQTPRDGNKQADIEYWSKQPGMSTGFWLGGSMPPCRLRQRKYDYEMAHYEVYLNKYVVSIAPFSTPACPDCSQNITQT